MSILTSYVIPFLIALGPLILVHELGHYLAARWCGVKVLRFAIGFGRPLFKYRAGADGTEWVLGIFPIGGYVKMLDEGEGEVAGHEAHRSFNRQTVGRRFAITAAGPLFNLLLAVVLYWGLYVVGGDELRPIAALTEAPASVARAAGVEEGDLVLSVDGEAVESWRDLSWKLLNRAVDRRETVLRVRTAAGDEAERMLDLRGFSLDDAGKKNPIALMGLRAQLPPARIARVGKGAAADRGGLREGDEIAAIDGKSTPTSGDVIEAVRASPGRALVFTVRRGGERHDFVVTPDAREEGGERIGFIDARFDLARLDHLFVTVRHGPLDALAKAIGLTGETCVLSLKTIGQMITGDISPKNISGPITIADIAGKSSQHGLSPFIRLLAFISISLGVLNLLPVPVLDGGHLLYYALEFIRGRPLSARVVELGQRIGLTLLLTLMAFALYNDINRLIPA
ncbi:MAG: RIP metalloprotease RseP [Azoarcus sp.]|jgi:regulator of sigma E protease|nr:RIP metalloprotease RseP [Azoarcus sp.]